MNIPLGKCPNCEIELEMTIPIGVVAGSGGGSVPPTVTDVYSTGADGYIRCGGGSYANARNGVSSKALNPQSSTFLYAGQEDADAGECYVYEGFVNFDLFGAGLTSGSVVSAAELSFFVDNDQSVTNFSLQARACNWGDTLTTADFVTGANLSALTLLADVNTSGIVVASRVTLAESGSSLRAAINSALAGDGILRMILVSSLTVAGTAPANFTASYLQLNTSEETGTAKDPKLTVTWN